MAFYNEIFIEEEEGLKHIGSCTGSNTPEYFDKVTTLKAFYEAIEELREDNGFYDHRAKHPFPWSSYKTSDHLIVLRPFLMFGFIKFGYRAWVSVSAPSVKDDHKAYFAPISKWGGDIKYNPIDLELIDLPKLKKL